MEILTMEVKPEDGWKARMAGKPENGWKAKKRCKS
jgi:hypothetical protein